MRRGVLALVVLALVAGGTLALASSGSERPPDAAGDRFLPGSSRAGAGGGLNQAPDANCEQWKAGTPRQRERAMDDLEGAFGRGGRGAVLPREEAFGVLDRACRPSFAGPWKLWKLYEHALGFQYDAGPSAR